MELVEHLVRELGVSARQAEGGAGLLLQLAKQRMPDEAFVRLAESTPAISDVIGKAPRTRAIQSGSLRQILSRWLGGLGGLLEVVDGFDKLGCDKSTIGRFADVLVEFYRGKAGDELAVSLHGALR